MGCLVFVSQFKNKDMKKAITKKKKIPPKAGEQKKPNGSHM